MPPGVALRTDVPPFFPSNAKAGLIGVANTPGTYNFTLHVSDSAGNATSQSATIQIAALAVMDEYTLPDAFVNVGYSPGSAGGYTLTALNAAGPVTWSVQTGSGSPPPGMSLSPAGVLSGTPTQAGVFSWTLQVADGVSTVFRGFNINVYAIAFTNSLQLPNATQYAAYNTTITASGGAGGFTFSTPGGGGLPNGLILSPSGLISGTINTGPGRYAFSVTATDTASVSYTRTMSIDVIGTPPQLPEIYVTNILENFGTIGVPYSGIISVVSGGTAPFTWTASGLPGGMAIRTYPFTQADYMAPDDVELWGTPTQAGMFNVTIAVTDAGGASATQVFPFQVSTLMVDGNDRLPPGTIGVFYSKPLRVLGGTGPYTVSQMDASFQPLPDGLLLNSGALLVSGTPLENGNFNPIFQFRDSASNSFLTTNYFTISDGASTITINQGFELGTATVGSFYNFQLSACCAPGYIWSLAGGTLPQGLSISPGGDLSGSPTLAGSYTFLLQVADSTNASNTGFRQFNVIVSPIAVSTSGPLPPGNVGTFFSQTLVASGGTGALTWSVTPFSNPLPPGLNLSGPGTLSGMPTQSGMFQLLLTVTDAAGNFYQRYFSLSIYPAGVAPPLGLSLGPNLGPFAIGGLTLQLSATGGVPPYNYSLSPSATPILGMRVVNWPLVPTNFATNAGAYVGAIVSPGIYPTSLRVTDSAGKIFDWPITITVSPLDIMISNGNLPKPQLGVLYSFTVIGSGGSGNYEWSATNLPPGILINSATGQISGIATVAGNFSAQITLTDVTNSNSVTQGFLIAVDPFTITTAGVLPEGTMNTAYNSLFSAPSCGSGCTWTVVSGGLPGGLSLSSTGLLSGTPTGTYNSFFTVQASGSAGIVQKVFSLTILNTASQPVFIQNGPIVCCISGIGSGFATALFAQGGTGPYSWTVTSGTLPPGLSLQGPGETISSQFGPGFTYLAGRLLQIGSFPFTLTATDSLGASNSQAFTVNVGPLWISYNYYNLPLPGTALTYNTPYAQPMLVYGGSGSYTSWLALTPMPSGLTLNATTGVVSGTPTNTGTFNPEIQVTDSLGNVLTAYINITVASPTGVNVNFGAGPNLGDYQQGFLGLINLNPNGGTPPYTITPVGALPPGFALESGDSLLSNANGSYDLAFMAQTPGTYVFTLQVADSLGNIGVRTFTVAVVPYTLYTTTTLADGSVGSPYSQQLLSFDNTSTATWSVTSGSALPPGFHVSAAGLLTGTPTMAGNYTFQLTGTDATGITINYGFTLRVSHLTIMSALNLPQAVLNVSYNFTFTATGGTSVLVWSATGLPSGLTLSGTGVLSGTTNSPGTYNVLVTVTDGTIALTKRYVIYATFTNPTELDISVTGALLADTTVGRSTSYTLPVDGGLPPYNWSVAPGSSLPPGLSLISGAQLPPNILPGSTQLVGVPTTAGVYSFDLIVHDSAGTQARRTFTLRVSNISVLSGGLPNGTVNTLYNLQLTAVGGTPPYNFSLSPLSLTSDTLPPGITLSASGLLSGVTTSTGSYGFKLTVVDSVGNSYSTSYSFMVFNASGLQISSVNVANSTVGAGFETHLATNGSSTYTWSLIAGSLPPGLSLQPGVNFGSTGTVLVGQSTMPGIFHYTLRATDNSNPANFADHAFTVTISPMQIVSPKEHSTGYNAKPPGSVGAVYPSVTYQIAGGSPPYSFAESPFVPLPAGMMLSALGVLSGTPTQVGNFGVAPVVTDSLGNTYDAPSSSLTITPSGVPPPLVASEAFGFDTPSVGVPMASYLYELNLNIQTGTAPFLWTLASGSSLPPGMSLLHGSNGVSDYLGGIPTQVGTFNFSLVVTDATAQLVTIPLSITVSPLSITPGSLSDGRVGTPYPPTALVASGGTAPYTFVAYAADGMPPGLSLSAAGVLSGTPTYPGFFQILVIVTDSNSLEVEKFYDVTIDNAAGQSPAISLGGVPIELFAAQGATTMLSGSVVPTATSGSLMYYMSLAGFPGATFPAVGTTGPTQSFFITVPATTPSGVYAGLLAVDAALATNRTDSIPVVVTVAPPPACTYILTPNAANLIAAAGGASFAVQTSPACGWTATVSNPTWVTLTSPSTGVGTGTITFVTQANTGSPRSSVITVAGQQYTINQFGPSSCTFNLSPPSLIVGASGGQATINIVSSCASTNPGSAWTATGFGATPASGQGSAAVTIVIPPNTSFSPAVLIVTIAGQALTVNQSAANCNATLGTPSASYGTAGGSGTVGVTIPGGCSYNTVLGPSWITVTSGGSGSTSGNLGYTVLPNSTTVSRTGSVFIGGTLFTVVQQALSCSVTVNTSTLGGPFGAGGGAGTIGIAASGASCSWTASSGASWATVSPASGNGSGSVGVSVSSNASSTTPRSTTLTVGGQTINLTQSGTSCIYSLQSSTGSVPATGGIGTVGVIAPAGCAWTSISSTPSWLSITASGNSGTSDVQFVAAPNTSASPLTGTLTIAGLNYTVTQAGAGCSYTLGTPSTTVAAGGLTAGAGSFSFSTVTPGCTPAAMGFANWITNVSTQFTGTSGRVTFGVSANGGGATRTGIIQVGDQTYTVGQTGAACAFSLDSTGQAISSAGSVVAPVGAPESVLGSPSAIGCPAPQASTNQPGIITLAALSGPLNNIYTQLYSVASPYLNLTLLPRYMQILFGGQIFAVKQYSW